MRLPDNSIGISDIKNWRECQRRWDFGMRRHTEGSEPPEDMHPDTLYGTVFHDMVEMVEALDLDDDEALQQAFNDHSADLDPGYYEMLMADLRTYRERDLTGVRTVANETEIKVPLLDWPCPDCEGKEQTIVDNCETCNGAGEITIFFRGRIDRLYQSLADPTVFYHRDYKTSKHRTSQEEVHKDIQFWAYNWAIFEWWPECEDLTQEYDQLRFGLLKTRKSEAQREHMRQWLVRQVTAILKAEEPKPRINDYCAWCPIMESCSEVDRLHQFETARINFLQKTLPDPGDDPEMEFLPTYIEKLPEVQKGLKLLKAYDARIKEVLKELPRDRREALGWKMTTKSQQVFSSESLHAMHELLGDDLFYEIITASKTNVEGALKGDPDALEQIMALARKVPGAQVLKHSEAA